MSKNRKITPIPTNRKEQFRYLFTHSFQNIAKNGGMVLLFSLPLLVVIGIESSMFLAYLSYAQGQDSSKEEILQGWALWALLFALLKLVSYFISFLGLAGSEKINKSLCFGDPIFYGHDFFLGIKENYGHFAWYALICGISFSSLSYFLEMGFLSSRSSFFYFSALIAGVFFFLLFGAVLLSFSLTSVYKNPILENLKIGFQLEIRHYFPLVFFSIGLLVIYFGLFFAKLFLPVFAFLAIFVLVLIYLVPLLLLGAEEYSLSLFDTYINKAYPEIYHKGLRP